MPGTRYKSSHLFQMEKEIFGNGRGSFKKVKGARDRKFKAKADVCRCKFTTRCTKRFNRKKALKPVEKRTSSDYIVQKYHLSIRQACNLLHLSASVYYYHPKEKEDDEIIKALKELAEKHYRWGFWMMYYYFRNEGKRWNHKRLYRVYTEMNLNLRSKRKKRLPLREKSYLLQPLSPNIHWSMDFMQDNLSDGKKFRTWNIIDDFNREALAIVPSKSITSNRVIMELTQLIEWRGKPDKIRVDNGPEFIAFALGEWCARNHIELKFIQPGKPAQNGYIERFNRTFREEVLSMHLFQSLEEVMERSNQWIYMYNHKRPHRSLGNLPPRAFLLKYGKLNVDNREEFPTFQQDINNIIINNKTLLLNVAN